RGHATPSQAPRHVPPMHTSPSAHSTPWQAKSMQKPSSLHSKPPGHMNSPELQEATHLPWKQWRPTGQSPSPSSTAPLQSLSMLSQRSSVGCTAGRHSGAPPSSEQSVSPAAQAPCRPVSHGCPAPLQVSPVTKKTKSLKSPSFSGPPPLFCADRQLIWLIGRSSKAM